MRYVLLAALAAGGCAEGTPPSPPAPGSVALSAPTPVAEKMQAPAPPKVK